MVGWSYHDFSQFEALGHGIEILPLSGIELLGIVESISVLFIPDETYQFLDLEAEKVRQVMGQRCSQIHHVSLLVAVLGIMVGVGVLTHLLLSRITLACAM